MIGKEISHYKILEKLGGGGMGVVFLAEGTWLERKVALKFLTHHLKLDDSARQRLIQETKTAAFLDHPNICTVYEIGTDNSRDYITMAYVEGKTLAEKKHCPGNILPGQISYWVILPFWKTR